MYTHPMYVCERCGWGHYHPLSYCNRCPGRLVRRDVPHLEHRCAPSSDRKEIDKRIQASRDFLAAQGVTYTGEYPPNNPQVQIARYRERLENSKAQAEEAEKAGDTRLAERIRKSVIPMWEASIRELEESG